MAVATFVYADWIARYPELANTGPPLAQLYFNEAQLYLDNSGCGQVTDQTQLTLLMYMITAHIAYLYNGDTSGPAAGGAVVGHVDQANQGSVSIATSVASQVAMVEAFWTQTKYGLSYWQATAQYRTARYRPSYRSPLVGNPYGFGFRRGFI